MQYTKLMLVLVGFAATLSAADPFAGTWKLNVAKSKYKVGAPPKDQILTITEAGADLSIKVAGTAADGSKVMMHYTMPMAGGVGKVIESTAYDGVSGKRIAPNEREMSYMKGGKSVYTAHSKVAADGKSITVSVKGANAQGQSVEGDVVYDKQK